MAEHCCDKFTNLVDLGMVKRGYYGNPTGKWDMGFWNGRFDRSVECSRNIDYCPFCGYNLNNGFKKYDGG